MIHISKAKKGYMVFYCGKNGEILSTSEIFTTKQSAINNIVASSRNFYKFVKEDEAKSNDLKDNVIYQDDTYKTPKLFLCTINYKLKNYALVQLTEKLYKEHPLFKKYFNFSIRKPKYKKTLQRVLNIVKSNTEKR